MADACLLTGATGFVGANLARLLLSKGLEVRALVRKGSPSETIDGLPLQRVEGDLLDPASLRAGCSGARYVFHLAADYRIWTRDPDRLYAVNVDGTANVLAAASAAGVERVVHCSSVAAVRPPLGHVPADEGSEYESLSEVIGDYKKSKLLSERLALEAAGRGAPVVVVNPAAPIGPYDAKPTPTGRIVLDFLNGRMPSYLDTGLNVVDVRDAAAGHWLAARLGRPGRRYILGGENLTFKAILDILSEITGLPAPRFKTPYALALAFGALDTARARLLGGEPVAPLDAVRMARHYMWFDSSRAREELGYRPGPARAALEDAARWFVESGRAQAPARAAATA